MQLPEIIKRILIKLNVMILMLMFKIMMGLKYLCQRLNGLMLYLDRKLYLTTLSIMAKNLVKIFISVVVNAFGLIEIIIRKQIQRMQQEYQI